MKVNSFGLIGVW